MSNQTVGSVYQQIIREVVETSRVDFEEGGVDESVLDELARSWQQKLSGLNVATFPWDPKPEPVPDMSYAQQGMPTQQMQPMQQPYGMPQQTGQAPHYPQPPQMQPMQQQPQYNPPPLGGPRIKTEPGLEPQAPAPIQNYGGMQNASTAAQRAAQNLQNQYGQRAQASINAMNAGMPQQQQPQQYQQPMQQQQPPRPPGPPIPRPSMTPSQYQQAMAAQAAQQKAALQQTNPTAQYPQTYAQQGQQQNQQGQAQASQQNQGQQQQQQQGQFPPQGQPQNQNQNQKPNGQNQGGNNSGAGNGIVKTQVDGGAESDDEDRHAHFGVFKTKGPNGQTIESQVEIDNMLRRQIEARGRAIEGGGLMVEMKKHNKRAAERKAMKGVEKRLRKVKVERAAQMDAADDSDEDKIKDEDDEDAINSDLDDPDEPADDDEDDEETQWVMLCMYDKVQRVKNKWKCVMKDGVLTINGKDYVFHKASGEYEW